MTGRTYISVILPLKLEWEPCYFTTCQDIRTGQRVRVQFAGKEYTGVVSRTGVPPQTSPSKIKEILSVEEGLECISEEELALWKTVAEYYMCSIGEVYKAAYPAMKISLEAAGARRAEAEQTRREKAKEKYLKKCIKLEERISKRQEAASKSKTESVRERYRQEIIKLQEELDAIRYEYENYALSSEVSGDIKHTEQVSDIVLSDAQSEAKGKIDKAFGQGKTVLLHGITGSGKTEIYIALALEAMSRGKNILYLVPEIALSRQLEDRLRNIFGSRLLTFHSGETVAHRYEVAGTIRRIASGDSGQYIVLGTRSSLFLPHHNLGLIVVDEEHDNSYKQDSPAPRYNGRDTAIMLGLIHGSSVILGSATPSLESLYNSRNGKFETVRLDRRYHNAQDTDIEIIDTIAERRKRGMKGSFSRKLIDHIQNALDHKGQVMILRSRRSYSPVLQCSECGFIPKCPHCNVSMSYHKDRDSLKCHYCGYRTIMPDCCPECGSGLTSLGAGTQKIEEEINGLFPTARTARLDSDSAKNKTFEKETISRFSKGDIDILIGTQIVAKGFDFKGLTLVAVLQADTLLGIQDFRADEKAVQLLEQFKGRCGRRDSKGLFVIQTSRPQHPVYQNMIHSSGMEPGEVQNRRMAFIDSLLDERQEFCYPPYSRIINIHIRDVYEERAERMSARLAVELEGFNTTGVFQPPVNKVADEHIRTIRVNLRKDRNLADNKTALLKRIRDFELREKYQGRIIIDVDPT
ncbi:MAG: primosomal protein N' [Bacteroidales bacterium]|nr:primosomal protein N' [Bacteroidales bacterium]